MGVSHLQLRFASRSASELCDQVARVRRRGRPAPRPARALVATRKDTRCRCSRCARTSGRRRSGRVDARHLRAPRSSRCSGPTRNGFDFLVLSEHHGIDDGWMPAPLTIAASILAMTERAPVLLSAVDPAVARPDPHRRADRGDRQRVPGPALDRLRRGLPRRRVRDGRRRPRASRQDPRGAGRRDAAGVDRRAVRVARAHGARHAQAGDATAPDGARRRGSARGGARAPPACGCRCCR